MSASLSWADWWAVFTNLPDEQKVPTWIENFGTLDSWKQFIRSKTDDIQIEIMKYAPQELIVEISSCLLPKARKKLLTRRN